MSQNFLATLQYWLDERGWNQAELARRTNRTTGAISLIFTGQRNPSAELLLDIAKALDLSPIKVFRAAGLLPTVSAKVENIEELDEIMANANEDERAEILRYARYILQARKITNPKTAEG